MKININSEMESVREERRELNLEITPQSTAVYKELLEVKNQISHNQIAKKQHI